MALFPELDKYKQQASHLQANIEHKEREDVKNTIMLGLLNSQVAIQSSQTGEGPLDVREVALSTAGRRGVPTKQFEGSGGVRKWLNRPAESARSSKSLPLQSGTEQWLLTTVEMGITNS